MDNINNSNEKNNIEKRNSKDFNSNNNNNVNNNNSENALNEKNPVQKNRINNIPINKDKSIIENNENNFFQLFHIYINDLWDYFRSSSFVPSYFYEKCRIINFQDLDNSVRENDLLELQLQEQGLNFKIKIENIIDTPNYKSFTHKSLEVPDGFSSFLINISLYLCTVHQYTGLNVKVILLEPDKNNYIYNYINENHMKIFGNISNYIEKNFQEYDQSESICIEKNIDEVWEILIRNNYSNIKTLLGNNATVKPTNSPNEIEVAHFTKNNILRIMVSTNIDYNERNILLQIISSTKPIPKQTILIKIVYINKNSCLLFLTHRIKQFLYNSHLNNYSLIKQKTLWLLKSNIENNINLD